MSQNAYELWYTPENGPRICVLRVHRWQLLAMEANGEINMEDVLSSDYVKTPTVDGNFPVMYPSWCTDYILNNSSANVKN